MAKVVYTDWRDRQFEPEIIGVYEDEFMAYGDREEKERELASQGYDSNEVTVWIEDVDIKKSDMADIPENIALAKLEELLQHNSAVKLAISDCGNGIAEIIAVDTFRKVVVVKWVTFTTCYDCQSYEESIFSTPTVIRMDEIAMEYEGVGEEIGDRQLRFCTEAVELTKEEMIEMRKESIAHLNDEKDVLIDMIASWIVQSGTAGTSNGNWIVYYSDVASEFHISEQWVEDNSDSIRDELYRREEVQEAEGEEDRSFNMMFWYSFCQEWDGTEDWGCLG